MTARTTQDLAAAAAPVAPLADVLIRDLVDAYPRTLTVLAPLSGTLLTPRIGGRDRREGWAAPRISADS